MLEWRTLPWRFIDHSTGVQATARFSLQIISLRHVYTWRPLASYAFIKIKLASCHLLLYVVYMYVSK